MRKCPYCRTNIPYNENYCYLCECTFGDPDPEGNSPPRLDLSKDEWRKPWVSGGLSLVGIGLGQFYNGETAKGLLFLILFLGAPVALPLYTTFNPLIVMLPVWAGAILDACISARKINRLKKKFRKKSIVFWPEVAVLVFIAALLLITAYAPHIAAQSMSVTAGEIADTKYPVYAVPLYESAIALSPNDTGIRMNEAELMHSLGRDEEARNDLAYVMTITPNDTAPIMMTGNLLYDNGEYGESVRYFEKALSINPNDAQIWIRKGDADLAISVMEMQTMRQKYRALTADTPALSDPSYNSSGNIDDVQSTQSYRDAIDSYNEAIKLDPLVSVEISSHVLASTQTLVNMYQGIMNDIGSANTTRG
jgi:hypothetical protein